MSGPVNESGTGFAHRLVGLQALLPRPLEHGRTEAMPRSKPGLRTVWAGDLNRSDVELFGHDD